LNVLLNLALAAIGHARLVLIQQAVGLLHGTMLAVYRGNLVSIYRVVAIGQVHHLHPRTPFAGMESAIREKIATTVQWIVDPVHHLPLTLTEE
jgi:hypothetical protein